MFSIPDFLEFFMSSGYLDSVEQLIPFAKQGLGWVLPGLLVFIGVNMFKHTKKQNQ